MKATLLAMVPAIKEQPNTSLTIWQGVNIKEPQGMFVKLQGKEGTTTSITMPTIASFKPFDIDFHKAPTTSPSMTTLHGKANVDPKPLFIMHGGTGKKNEFSLGKIKDNTKRS